MSNQQKIEKPLHNKAWRKSDWRSLTSDIYLKKREKAIEAFLHPQRYWFKYYMKESFKMFNLARENSIYTRRRIKYAFYAMKKAFKCLFVRDINNIKNKGDN